MNDKARGRFASLVGCLVVGILAGATAGGQSRLVAVHTLPDASLDYPILRVQFVSETVAWGYGLRSLWQTHDGGIHWENIRLPELAKSPSLKRKLQSPANLTSAHFDSAKAGWIEIESDAPAAVQIIYRTEDAGKTWRELPTLPQSATVVYFLKGGSIGWAGGASRNPDRSISLVPGCITPPDESVLHALLFHTTDGGEHWIEQSLPQSTGCPIRAIYFRNAQDGVAASGHHLFQTSDAGATWKPSEFQTNCPHSAWLREEQNERNESISIFFIDSKLGWLGSQDGFLLKTLDAGRTWCQIKQPGEIANASEGIGDFGALYFNTTTHGWVLGGDQRLYETSDGGASLAKVAGAEDLYSMSCYASRCWALSDGKLYRTEKN